MAILHRALFTWFIFLVFLILLCLRLESRTHWNWFIVFIPMWVYDSILLIYVLFHMVSHCRNGIERFRSTINKNVWYIAAIALKMAAQIIICIKLEFTNGYLPIYVVMTPIWMLLPVLCVEVFMHLIKHSSRSIFVTKMPLDFENAGDIKSSVVTEVPAGTTVVLNCDSNDYNHNFMFWLFDKNKVIGPGNEYDERKYKYEVLSGKLHIDSVSYTESGYYKCVSKNLDGSGITVGEVEMIVKGSSFSTMDAIKLTAIIVSILVLIICAVIYFRLKKEWNKYEGHTVVPVEEEDEEGEEIYNKTTTTITPPVPGPSRNPSSEHLLYGIDNQGLDTDFNSVFENIQIKSPNASLI